LHSVTLVGLGQIGMGYDLELDPMQYIYSHARAFSQNPNFTLKLGIDPDKEKRKIFESVYHSKTISSLSEIDNDFQTDILVIATHTNTHLDIIKTFLEITSPKLIICEKPLAYRLDDAEEIVKICDEKSIPLFVNYIRKSLPETQMIKKMIEESSGSEIKGVCYYSKGLVHNGSHFLNLLNNWFGKPKVAKKVASGRNISEFDSEPDFFVEYSKARIHFISVKEEDYSFYNIELVLPSGFLHYNRGGEEILWYSKLENPILKGYYSLSSEPTVIPNQMNKYQEIVVNQLENFLENKEYILCSGKDALQILKLIVGNLL
jgi:predicted dehydrogenase